MVLHASTQILITAQQAPISAGPLASQTPPTAQLALTGLVLSARPTPLALLALISQELFAFPSHSFVLQD